MVYEDDDDEERYPTTPTLQHFHAQQTMEYEDDAEDNEESYPAIPTLQQQQQQQQHQHQRAQSPPTSSRPVQATFTYDADATQSPPRQPRP